MNNLIEINMNDFFTLRCNRTRAHILKLNMNYSRLNCRKYFFVNSFCYKETVNLTV